MKNILGSAPCRLDISFKDAEGKAYQQSAVIKTNPKTEGTEEFTLFSNGDTIIGEVCAPHALACMRACMHAEGGNPLLPGTRDAAFNETC